MRNLWIDQSQENTANKKIVLLKTRILNTGKEALENFTAFHGLPQKCKIPVLDPYHPDVKPFYKTWSVPDCDYPQLSEVTDEGYLQVN